MPMPLLKVRFISKSLMAAVACSQAKSSLCGQLPWRSSAAMPSGRTRGMFSNRPPPVMCARALIGCAASAASTGFTYSRVGAMSASRNGLPSRLAGSLEASKPVPDPAARSMHLRTRLKPLECTPLLARPRTMSPLRTVAPVRMLDFSTTPTAKPARSYSPDGYMPGISAVSPPISAQPDSSQPRAMPPMTAAAVSRSSLPQAK